MGKLYDEKSIESLSPLEFTRLRPGVYAGDTTYSTQLLVEIFSNAVDEYNAGHGNRINVTIDKDIVTVRDYGQGFIPNSFREDGKTILEAAFSVLNTSGKYREDGSYEGTSLGSFGIGSKITTFLSHWLIVSTYRDGKREEIHFKEGVFDVRYNGAPKSDEAKADVKLGGTEVSWQPSEEFFKNTEVEIAKVKVLFKTISCLCPGLTINLNDNGKTETFYSENGLNDLVDEAVKDKELIANRFNLNYAEGKNKLNLVLTYTSNYSSTFIHYINSGLVETSPILTQIKTAITREMNKFFREKKWLKEKDENLTGDDIQEGMYIIFNAVSAGVAYDSQVKTRVVNIDCKSQVNAFVEELQNWLEYNEKEVKIIADKAIKARTAREAAKKARESVREDKKKKEKVLKFDSKLADCNSKNRLECEIYITEGDSASGNLKTARDNKFQAVMPVRGKILNTQKATLAQIQKNAEIMTMIDAFGLKIDPKTMKVTYNKEDLRYGKIIIAADADVDGAHIRNLFYTFIWNFCPKLIEEGYVYTLVAPLYRIIFSNGDSIYLKNDDELNAWRASYKGGKKYEVKRMKGLGEMDVDETESTLIHPDKRTIQQITVEDIPGTDILFEQLMGQDVNARKTYIKKHSQEATYNAE